MKLDLGMRVRCGDEVVGELADVVVDPVAQRVTHVVVKRHHVSGEARLAGIELVEAGGDERTLSLSCSADELERLPNVERFAYTRLGKEVVADPDWDVGVSDVLVQPAYDSAGLAGYGGGYVGAPPEDVGVVYDQVPKGEVELRHASTVRTADGDYLGDVGGFVTAADQGITHVLVERGHLWLRREISVPIAKIASVQSDSITVGVSVPELDALPARRIHRWPWSRRRT